MIFCGPFYDEAQKLYEKGIQLDPKNPILNNNLGLNYVKRGQKEKGIKYLNL